MLLVDFGYETNLDINVTVRFHGKLSKCVNVMYVNGIDGFM
jgi:hypothetical protein